MQDSTSGQQADAKGPTRLTILGGGPSALCCAYWLTSTPELRARYSITLYTLGWRLGGKGASGRGPDGRIQEHGLHILFGAYHSFFRTMRDCYSVLDRPADHPLRTWRDAFKPHDFGVVEDYANGGWHPWALAFPRNHAVPGDPGTVLMSSRDYLGMAIQSAISLVFGWRVGFDVSERMSVTPFENDKPDLLVRAALGVLRRLYEVSVTAARLVDHSAVLTLVRTLRKMAWPLMLGLSRLNPDAYRFWLGVDFLTAFLGGLIVDGVLEEGGFDRIDHLDFREWLTRHGAHADTLQGPWARTIYDAAFSYAGGDPDHQRIAAGVAVHLLIGFGMYREAMYFKMQTGMGDAVFAPMYEVLRDRGVRFEFFHKVDSLALNDAKDAVSRVHLTRQAKLKSNLETYQPLVQVRGVDCWPAEPIYDQLESGDELRGVDLESYYQASPHARTVTLESGVDYDKLVFAIPIGAVPFVCGELLDASPRWRAMANHVTSVETVSFQIWTKQDIGELGWKMPSPLLSLYVEPLNTWADMSQVLWSEDWPEGRAPRSVQYFTGPQPGPHFAPFPEEDPDFEQRSYERARSLSLQFLRKSAANLLPNTAAAADPDDPFDWSALFDPNNRSGEARFESQYWRSNCGPSERCTLAVPGSGRYRLAADDTGFDNLVISGDWIDNGIQAACMEGAFNSGILTARAVSGIEFEIDGVWYSGTRGPLHPRGFGHIQVPRDDALIDDTVIQWWYWTGHLTAESGRRYGCQVVFFVGEIDGEVIAARSGQAALSDVSNQRFYSRCSSVPGAPGEFDDAFALSVEEGEISARGGDGRDRLHFTADGHVVDIFAEQVGNTQFHYDGELHRYSFGGNTYYYSRPLMRASGTIRLPNGEEETVHGDLWFDRQWGELLEAVVRGWQWFAIQLEDNAQLMIAAPNDVKDERFAVIMHPTRPPERFGPTEFALDVLDWWTSPHTGTRYPHGWDLRVGRYKLRVAPLIADQEMPGAFWVGPRYWEGACEVTGTVPGKAYVELAGFGR